MYMLVPSTRLIIWAALLVPFALAGALAPAAAALGWGYILILVGVSLWDALRALPPQRRPQIQLPAVIRLARQRPGTIPLELHLPQQHGSTMRIGLPLPTEIITETDYLDVTCPPGPKRVTVAWPCTATQRGQYTLHKTYAEMASPGGLWRIRTHSACDCEIRVYPDLSSDRKRLAAIFLNRSGFGMHPQRLIGQGREFERLRDYLPGDSYNDIHWKATARRGHPITKLFQIERTREIVVAVDTSRLTSRNLDNAPLLERFLNTTLMLGQVAQHQGDQFGLLTFDSRVRTFVRPGSGRAHYGVCRDTLYTTQPAFVSPDFNALFAFVRHRMPKRALLVVLTDLSDPIIAENFRDSVQLVNRHHLVLVVMMQPRGVLPLFAPPHPQATDDLYTRLGGHMRWRALRETQQQLRHQGVTLQFAGETQLTHEVVTQYMRIKARQAL